MGLRLVYVLVSLGEILTSSSMIACRLQRALMRTPNALTTVPREPAKQKRALRKMIRRTAAIQIRTNGYFGGYISKRQKLGKLETRKCVDKLYTLRERQSGKSEFEQQRAVSGRMITDIEMNGTLRGAVEEFNLCANLCSSDVLFAECIRTFPTIDVDAQQLLHRLEVELERLPEMKTQVYVPPTRRPNIRNNRSKAHYVDVYGFRPLNDTPFAHLSPFEFLQYWIAEALTAPSASENISRTT